MIYFPAFRKSFDVNTIPQEGIVALHELGQLVFGGAIEQAVIPLIHGQRSADEIADALADRFPRENVYHALQSMQQQGLVYDRSALDGPALPAAWHYLAWDLDRAQKAVTQTQISVLGTAGLGVTPDIQTFAAYDLKVGIDGSFLVVIAGDYLEPELAAINREALERDRPWMLVKPVGTLALIGPIFRPGVSACWECLAQRLYGRREIERYGENHGAAQIASAAPFNAAASAVQSIAALQIAKWVATGASPLLEGKIVSFDLTSLVTCTHIVNKRPCCAACGTPTPNVRRWPLLDNQARRSSIDSGHRSLSAEETYIRHQHHISPITGIVSELVPIRAPSEEIVKLYIANHNFALSSESLYFLTNSMQTKSCGKGMTEAQARTSALCEALERYCGVYKGDEVAIHKSFRELGDIRSARPTNGVARSSTSSPHRSPLMRRSIGRRCGPSHRARFVICRPHTSITAIQRRGNSPPVGLTPTEMLPAIPSKKQSSRDSWSWWSATRSRSGGTIVYHGPVSIWRPSISPISANASTFMLGMVVSFGPSISPRISAFRPLSP
jgi:bacteriocin biosynthesis cyclodehydratase domain-containing protein